MFLWPLLFIHFALADNFSIEEFCFTSAQNMQDAAQRAKIIFIPSDVTSQNGSCLTVKVREHRRELVQNYIRNIDPQVRIQFSSAELKRDLCELKVEKIKTTILKVDEVKVHSELAASSSSSRQESKDVSQIKTMNQFELTFNQDVVMGTCRFVTPDRYEITLEIRKDPKQFVVSDQETSRLTTNLQLNKGQRIEIGSIMKDLRKENTKVEISPSLALKKSENMAGENVFLSIE